MKKLFLIPLLLASSYSYAIDATITLTAKPSNIIVTTPGSGMAHFSLISSNFPSGTGLKTKTLQGIDWSTTSYPNNTGEQVELCYWRPYNSTNQTCVPILPNSSGTVTVFNNESFGPGAGVLIRHTVTGGQAPGYPAGSDTVTYRYSY